MIYLIRDLYYFVHSNFWFLWYLIHLLWYLIHITFTRIFLIMCIVISIKLGPSFFSSWYVTQCCLLFRSICFSMYILYFSFFSYYLWPNLVITSCTIVGIDLFYPIIVFGFCHYHILYAFLFRCFHTPSLTVISLLFWDFSMVYRVLYLL